MIGFIIRRAIAMFATIFAVSVVTFVIIQLPPGDYLTTLAATMSSQGESVDSAQLDVLREKYGLDQPYVVQYAKWMGNILLHGDFGNSFELKRPVADLIWERLGLTFVFSFLTLIFIWVVALPIGIYSAVKKYSLGDYVATFIGFIGLAVPNFLLALILSYVSFKYFHQSVGGLFSSEYVDAPWSWGKVVDMFAHLWVPIIVLGTAGTASLIRIMRANLLDELYKPYVTMARAKGMSEIRLLMKYPVRVALNPFISTIGWVLPELVSGATITAIVLSLPMTGPLLLRALIAQDMYLAGSFILMLSVLTIVGTLVSDILLAWLDPRIKFE